MRRLRGRVRCSRPIPRATDQVDEAIYVQSNNRVFAVVFWFIVLGPIGAWAVRVADLARRRALFREQREASNGTGADTRASDATDSIHALLVWVPARLAALGYALAGSFDHGRSAWSTFPDSDAGSIGESSEKLLARVGNAALAFQPAPDASELENHVANARAARKLVYRALIFWAVLLALLTLFGRAV